MTRPRPVEVELAPGEIRALADLSTRHPLTQARISEVRELDGVGWLHITFAERTSHWPYTRAHRYVASPTGRAWRADENWERGDEVRDQDYDTSATAQSRSRAGAPRKA